MLKTQKWEVYLIYQQYLYKYVHKMSNNGYEKIGVGKEETRNLPKSRSTFLGDTWILDLATIVTSKKD